jgi:ornithine cyclodeaminase
MALFLSEADVAQLLDMDLALEAVETAHRAHAQGRAIDIPRQRTRVPTASLHILQGALLDEGVIGYKAYTASRDGIRFLVHVFDAASGRLQGIIEADRLGMMRTGAAGGVAAKYLTRADARTAAILGAGWQAQGQLEALCRVRELERVRVFSRNAERCAAFCAEMSARLGRAVSPAGGAEEAVRDADVVVTITTSATPVFDGAWLAEGCHVTAAGSNALIRREIDETSVRRAAVVCVDSRPMALAEAGDLQGPLEKGRLHERQLVELGDIVAGLRPGRRQAADITLFESQGMAIQDLAIARRLLVRAAERKIGSELELGNI